MDKKEFIRKQTIKDMIENKEQKYTNFGEVIKALKRDKLAKRKDSNFIIIKQIDSFIDKGIIPRMTSLPNSAKRFIVNTNDGVIKYNNQCLKFNIEDNTATNYIPDWDDIFANDWIIID